jgi:hypothetical protein
VPCPPLPKNQPSPERYSVVTIVTVVTVVWPMMLWWLPRRKIVAELLRLGRAEEAKRVIEHIALLAEDAQVSDSMVGQEESLGPMGGLPLEAVVRGGG